MMKKTLLLVLAFLTAPAMADPVPGMGIAAIVGGEAISSYDVNSRVKFVIATAKLSGADVAERIRPQVMRSLINEKLQLQEATKNGITVSDDEIAKAISAIENQRGMAEGSIDHMLDASGVPKTTFVDQIRAQLAWNKLLMRKVRPQVKISDEEIALAGKRVIEAPPVKQELKIGIIALTVDKPSRAKEMQKLSEKLVKEIRGGASFEEVARQFASNTASNGGKVATFWVMPGQLDPNVGRALTNATPGTITDPVATPQGYTIVKVYDTRAIGGSAPMFTEVAIKEIVMKLKADADKTDAGILLHIGQEVAEHPGSCTEKGIAGIKDLDDVDIEVNFRHSSINDLPPALKVIIEPLKAGEISSPLASDEGLRLYMLCDKKQTSTPTPDNDRLGAMLLQEKMELEAQKYLRNLQRDTFIDVR